MDAHPHRRSCDFETLRHRQSGAPSKRIAFWTKLMTMLGAFDPIPPKGREAFTTSKPIATCARVVVLTATRHGLEELDICFGPAPARARASGVRLETIPV